MPEQPHFLIPPFRSDGYLPEGVHLATEADVLFRFGASTGRRRHLILRLARWLEIARHISAARILIDGSFVTVKASPDNLDAVILLPNNF